MAKPPPDGRRGGLRASTATLPHSPRSYAAMARAIGVGNSRGHAQPKAIRPATKTIPNTRTIPTARTRRSTTFTPGIYPGLSLHQTSPAEATYSRLGKLLPSSDKALVLSKPPPPYTARAICVLV